MSQKLKFALKKRLISSLVVISAVLALGGVAIAAAPVNPIENWADITTLLERVGVFPSTNYATVADGLEDLNSDVEGVQTGVDNVQSAITAIGGKFDDSETGLGAIKDDTETLIEFADAADVMLDSFTEPLARIDETVSQSALMESYSGNALLEVDGPETVLVESYEGQTRHVSLTVRFGNGEEGRHFQFGDGFLVRSRLDEADQGVILAVRIITTPEEGTPEYGLWWVESAVSYTVEFNAAQWELVFASFEGDLPVYWNYTVTFPASS